MQLLTTEQGERAIRCDLFEETVRLAPNHLIVLTHEDGTANWYALGNAVQTEDSWIVPMQIVGDDDEAEARRTGYIAHFVIGRDSKLSES